MSTADAALIALGERFERRLLEYMDAWLAWAPLMRAARAEAESDLAGFSVAIQRNGCDAAQARLSELEDEMQPLAEHDRGRTCARSPPGWAKLPHREWFHENGSLDSSFNLLCGGFGRFPRFIRKQHERLVAARADVEPVSERTVSNPNAHARGSSYAPQQMPCSVLRSLVRKAK